MVTVTHNTFTHIHTYTHTHIHTHIHTKKKTCYVDVPALNSYCILENLFFLEKKFIIKF